MSLEQTSFTESEGSDDAPVAEAKQAPDSGAARMPSKPSAAMLASGARAGGVSVETAWKVYQAMLKNAD
jgi:hypothetical protein